MSDHNEQNIDNGPTDAMAALAIIVLAVLGAIHFVYTGGLIAFFDKVFG